MSEQDGGARALRGRHVVVTGGGRGIGAAVAAHFDDLGARLTLMGRNGNALEQRCEALADARAVTVDVTDEGSVESAFARAVEAAGPVDVLINNAGAAESAPFTRTDTALWNRMLSVNLTGVFHCTRAVLGAMNERGWGRVINVASVAGLRGYPYVAAYCAAKHGVIGLTRALGMESARKGVTVNALCPGYTDTEMLDDALRNIVDKTGCTREQAEEQLKARNPQHRFIEAREVAVTAAWLCLPGSESITAQAIALAGGEVM